MAEAGLVKMENHLEKFFKPNMATPGEYDYEVLPRQTKTRRQRIAYNQAQHRNLCRKVKIDTENSFNMLFTDLKTVMKSATPAQWDDLKERVMTSNELFWKIGAELRISTKASQAAEYMRMSKLINTVADYLDKLQVKFGTDDNPNSADDTSRNLQMLMQVGVTHLPQREVLKIIANLFDMIKHCNEPFVMKHMIDKSGREALVVAPAPISRERVLNFIAEANDATVRELQIAPERLKPDEPTQTRRDKIIRILDEIHEPVNDDKQLDIDNITKLLSELGPFYAPKSEEPSRMIFGKSESARSYLIRYEISTKPINYIDDYLNVAEACLN